MVIKYIFDNVLCSKLLLHKTLSNIYLIIVDEYNEKLTEYWISITITDEKDFLLTIKLTAENSSPFCKTVTV